MLSFFMKKLFSYSKKPPKEKEFNIKKSKFNNELLSICMKKPDMFINAVAANIFLNKYP